MFENKLCMKRFNAVSFLNQNAKKVSLFLHSILIFARSNCINKQF